MKRMTRLQCALAAAALGAALQLAAATPGSDTVKIGKETKKTVGTLTKAVNGDVACYLTLKDDRGVVFDEMADFSICEQPKLIGKRLKLAYSLENVMADECQGNPDCTKSKKVALVKSVQRLGGPPSKPPAPPKATPQTSFCTPAEAIVFACHTGTKLVSVCASKDASPTRGYLQYRSGKPDAREPLEATIPALQTIPPKSANGENVPFAGGAGSWLRFHNGPFAYVVYSGIGKWGPHGETREKQGVFVERAGKRAANLQCSGALISELGPEWFEKTGVTSNGEEFDFP